MASGDEEQKAYEARLQRRLQLLKQRLEAGTITFAPGLRVIDRLGAVRYKADGSIDLATVDGLVRSLALAAEHLHDREELKESISLAEIQSSYFAFLERVFGEFYKIMLERNLTPHDAGIALSQKASIALDVAGHIPELLGTIEEFWRQTGEAAHAHVEDLHGSSKGVFGGDLFPSHSQNIASRCGIYLDTIVLPDPFLRSKPIFERWTTEKQAYYFIKHGLNLLQYRDLACADVNPPIVVVVPDITALNKAEMEFVFKLSQGDVVAHGNRVFGTRFATTEELMDYARTLDTVDRVVAALAEPRRALFDTEWNGSTRDHIVRATTDQHAQLLGTDNPGLIVASQAVGRMSTSNELLIKARRLGGAPLIDAPTSWQYFVWKLEYDADAASQQTNLKNLHVVRGLQDLADNEMEWLGNVPIDALIEVRKSGAIHEIREILAQGVGELTNANPADFRQTSEKVFDNLDSAFSDHRRRVAELAAKKWTFAKSDVGSWLVVGSLAIASAATGLPSWGLAAIAADQLLDAPKLRDIPQSIRDLAAETQKVKSSPVGLLFKYSRNKT